MRYLIGWVTHTLCESRRLTGLERGETREGVRSEGVAVLITLVIRPGDAEAGSNLVQPPNGELELVLDFEGSRMVSAALLRATAGERVEDADGSLVASRGHFSAIPLGGESKIVHVAAAKSRVMPDIKRGARSLARERTLRQIEFADSLIARLADSASQVDPDCLRRRELMINTRPQADPVGRLLDLA